MISKSSKRRKILYVCPLAHHGGHCPSAILTETMALTRAGFDVTLLTFNGLPEEGKPSRIQQITVLSQGRFSAFILYFTKIFNHWILTQNIVVLLEQFSSLAKAIFLKKKMKYDVIHLRDGNPFLFLVFFLNFFLKDYKWVLHMTVDPSKGILQKVDYAKMWQPIYRRSLLRNRFVFLCENEIIKREYERVMDGLFCKRVIYVPLATQYVGNAFHKEEARQLLRLPKNKALLLSFGSLHSGKDLKVIAYASQDLPDVYLVIAGKASSSTIDEVKSINKHLIVRNYYIPEEEKPLYYAAADAVILSYHKTFLERRSGAMLWDACKFGATIIASDGGQLGELTRSFQLGLTFEPENALSLRNAIVRCLNLKREGLRILKRNCKTFCINFSTERWSERCKRIYEYLFRG